MYLIFRTIRRTLSSKFGRKMGVRLVVRMQLTWLLVGLGCGGGAGSPEAGAGSLLQEAGGGKSGVMLRALGWEEGVSQLCQAREAGAESLLQHSIVLGRSVQAVQALQEKKACCACACLLHVTGGPPLTLTQANSTAGSSANVALQLLKNCSSHHAWAGWDDGS